MSDPFDAEAIAKEWLASRPPYEGEIGVIRTCEPAALTALLTRVRREALEGAAGAGETVVDAYERAACAARTQEVRDLQTNRMLGASNAVREIRALIPEGVVRGSLDALEPGDIDDE